MSHLFRINSQNSELSEPMVGAVYCAMTYDNNRGVHVDGVIAEYAGNGRFFTDDCHYCTGLQDSICQEMSKADFIMEC